ncbi:fusidic acid esterase FusH [Actinoplanes philippinensis]|uniref:Repeat domain-containing protein n=1 Tax=Actinoplanes philippinensis TaxID=35752 RepID=A0A1I2HL62_9ACTN|nr:FG-GAP-like repeat-containing protein [Actinoplanes philippinensis]GIE82956.1 fusidic acid esterase FusH [Actinoplanes philippinensis]SFF29516.1 Repeat domain-containing protein [Actinoplanes philippinensis]
MLKKRALSVLTVGAAVAVTPWAAVPALAATATTASAYGFVTKIEVGTPGAADARACTGALVRAEWVVTSAACFAQNGVPIADGAPPQATSVTVGRPDLSTTGGQVLAATRVVSHPDRDVALVQLVRPSTTGATIGLGATAPAAGEALRLAGYGRTRTEWVPRVQHAGDFTVASAPATASLQLDNQPDTTVCKGDAGGPIFREAGGSAQLVAVTSTGGQQGCVGAASDAPAGAVGARVDDIAAWVTSVTTPVTVLPANSGDVHTGSGRWADFDGDGKDDYLFIQASGAVDVYLNRGGGSRGWLPLGQVARGVTTDRSKVRFADFDGDAKADYLLFDDAGAVTLYLNRGGDGAGGWQNRGKVASGVTSDRSKVRFADLNGDGKTDYLIVQDTGQVDAYVNIGGDGAGGWQNRGKVASGLSTDRTKVRFHDFDGDGKDDYLLFDDNGGVTVYFNRGGDGAGGWQNRGKVASGLTKDRTLVRFQDFDGDRKDDYLLINTASGEPTSVYLNRGGDGAGGWEVLQRS